MQELHFLKKTNVQFLHILFLKNVQLLHITLAFFEQAEELRTGLKKKIDLLNQQQLEQNFALTQEILKDGIKIYG